MNFLKPPNLFGWCQWLQRRRRKPFELSVIHGQTQWIASPGHICLYHSWNPNLRMYRECRRGHCLGKTERRPCPLLEASTLTLMPWFCHPPLSLLLSFSTFHWLSPSFLSPLLAFLSSCPDLLSLPSWPKQLPPSSLCFTAGIGPLNNKFGGFQFLPAPVLQEQLNAYIGEALSRPRVLRS